MPKFHDSIKARMREALGCRTDAELARRLGRHPGPISQWRRRGSIPKHAIDTAALISGRSVEWILTGKDPQGGAGVVREPGAPYGLGDRAKDLIEAIQKEPELIPWLEGLASILMSGDPEKVAAIQGNIQAFREAMGQGRVVEARAGPKVSRKLAGKKQVSR